MIDLILAGCIAALIAALGLLEGMRRQWRDLLMAERARREAEMEEIQRAVRTQGDQRVKLARIARIAGGLAILAMLASCTPLRPNYAQGETAEEFCADWALMRWSPRGDKDDHRTFGYWYKWCLADENRRLTEDLKAIQK